MFSFLDNFLDFMLFFVFLSCIPHYDVMMIVFQVKSLTYTIYVFEPMNLLGALTCLLKQHFSLS